VREGLRAIDRSLPDGMRDYVLLRVAVVTGWRVNELASLRGGDVQNQGGRVTLHCRRAKGAKVKRETLSADASRALLGYLHQIYGPRLEGLPNDAPIWISYSRNSSRRQALSVRSLETISRVRLGVHFHALRHTFARAMEDAGAKVSEIQSRLGHESLQTTGRYLAALKSNENPYSEKLDELFGV
jgi:integrase